MQRSGIAAAAGGLFLSLAACQPLDAPGPDVPMQPLPRGRVLAVTPTAAPNMNVVTIWIEGDGGILTLVTYDHGQGTVNRSVTVPRE